jgi:hypothetical protein
MTDTNDRRPFGIQKVCEGRTVDLGTSNISPLMHLMGIQQQGSWDSDFLNILT